MCLLKSCQVSCRIKRIWMLPRMVKALRPIHTILLASSCFAILSTTNEALGCSCMFVGLAEEVRITHVIFTGTVTEITEEPPGQRVTFYVDTWWKGGVSQTVTIFTDAIRMPAAACGYPFRLGRRYLVFAHSTRFHELWTSTCTRTKLAEGAIEEQRFLEGSASEEGK